MPKGVYDRKAKEEIMTTPTEQKLFPVLLNKNYVPRGQFEIIGYLKPAVERKNAAGQMVVVEPAEFKEGEMHPAPHPGVGYPNKIWAGTHIRLPLDEAKGLVEKKIADRADALAA